MCLWGACICSILPSCVGTLASQGGWQPDFPQLLAWSSRAAQECGAQWGHHIGPCTPDRQHIHKLQSHQPSVQRLLTRQADWAGWRWTRARGS